MPPDYLLQCSRCGSESVWDTEAVSPVGTPEAGEPVLWFCAECGCELRHHIADLFVMTDKLHREIALATELDRATVDRAMEAVYRQRRRAAREEPSGAQDAAVEAELVAEATGLSLEAVADIAVAEADWMLRRGYLADRVSKE